MLYFTFLPFGFVDLLCDRVIVPHIPVWLRTAEGPDRPLLRLAPQRRLPGRVPVKQNLLVLGESGGEGVEGHTEPVRRPSVRTSDNTQLGAGLITPHLTENAVRDRCGYNHN